MNLRLAVTVFVTSLALVPIVTRGQDIPPTSVSSTTEKLVEKSTETIRVASFNVSLYGKQAGEVAERLLAGDDSQATDLATVIQTVRPDILLLCEIDHEPDGRTLNTFADGYLAKGNAAIDYPHRWSIPTNTGLLGDLDLDSDGDVELPTDAHGFGQYPGQYAMAVLSRFEIDRDAIRTFQTFRWSTMPGALKPVDPVTGQPYYSDTVWQSLRLSSKNHVDVPVSIPSSTSQASAGVEPSNHRVLHLLASHPTPPVFDGDEDRNGKRNHDEIRFWDEYISKPKAEWIIDDQGAMGGLKSDFTADAMFVIAGDLNSDPKQGDSLRSGIANLISNPRVRDAMPTSSQHGISTAKFGRNEIRVDYVLPSSNLHVIRSAVVWPDAQTDLGKRVRATDHRMVWIDIERPSPR
ncbi:endonuclease/exonuclease/phosphatase family protein [Rhodopirellula baltica]|uniref:Endonuclease/exonuclease/phosphatase n=1 Tax=Rhodopirellula baltica SWK14 TaxID=993516 RepID=L7CI91_RHOBT|nr:endonuclease/exonuclease/phosphatase family protein [Rhodopirellula baltica]ELP33352.1 Endonuclease/exonuclease/phosphatase [Rhodopirellula baltica SWK14]